LFANLF